MCLCMYFYRPHTKDVRVFPLSFCFEIGSLTEFTNFTEQQASDVLRSLLLQHWDYKCMVPWPPFCMGAGNLNSVPYICATSILQTKPES